MAETQPGESTGTDHGRGEEGRVHGHSGQFGVSDDRRAELSRLEQDAGVAHRASDESVTQRPEKDSAREARLTSDRSLERPGDRH